MGERLKRPLHIPNSFFYYPTFACLVYLFFFYPFCILAKSLHDEMMEGRNRREKTKIGGGRKAKRMNGTIE
jgi:hypothetical protein